MRLVLRQKDGESKEYQFAQGPIEIGRGADNHVFLPDRTVSKKHAVIVCDGDGRWEVQDLGSANKTYLNGEVVAKAPIKTGDAIRITDFTLEVSLDERPPDSSAQFEDTLNLEAGLATPLHETVVRKPDAGHAPAMRLAAKRLSDFSYACDAICKATNLEELLVALLNVTVQQFSAFHTWCALREQPSGPMTYHTGKRRDGKPVELGDLMLADKINQADSMIFQTEKQLKEFGDKIPADKKHPIENALAKLKEAHKNQDLAAIDAAMTELNNVFQAASQEMYNAAGAQGGGQQAYQEPQQGSGNGQPKQDGEVTDVDFEEVK